MTAELACHLVDLNALSMPISLTLGYLQSVAQADPRIHGRCEFSSHSLSVTDGLEPAWSRIRDLITRRSAERHVFAFTNYFWNRPFNLTLAERVKAIAPNSLVVFGGNEVTDQGHALLNATSPVDVIVNGEGELVFANLLAAHLDHCSDLRGIRGLSFRDEDGHLVTTQPQDRIDTLDSIPSPFLTGVYDDTLWASTRNVVYEFSRGCPFKCAFCFWGGAIGTKTRRFSQDRIREDLEFLYARMPMFSSIMLADANFGMYEADVEMARFMATLGRKHRKLILFYAGGWAKNTNRRVMETAKILYQHRMIGSVTLSAQSLSQEALAIADRKNIPFEYYRQLQAEFHREGIPTYTELIWGMPGETYNSFIDGIERVITSGGTPVIYPLLLLNNTEYSTPAVRERHQIRSRMMPYLLSSPVQTEIVIGHSQLSYEEWLRGMALRLAVSLFYGGILKFIMKRLHAVHQLGYGEMLERLVDYSTHGGLHSHSLFRRLFANYIATWHSVNDYDQELIDGVLGEAERAQNAAPHENALWKTLIENEATTNALVRELATMLAEPVGADLSNEFPDWLVFQNLIIQAIAQLAQGGAGQITTDLAHERLADYAGFNIAEEHADGTRRLQTRRAYKCLNIPMFTFRVLAGNIDTLRVFEQADQPVHVSSSADVTVNLSEATRGSFQ